MLHKNYRQVVLAASWVVAASTYANSAASAEVLAYSSVQINSYTSVNHPAPDYIFDTTAGPVQASVAGSATLAYNNGSGQFLIKPVSDNVFASASLAAGELKARSSLSFGANLNSVSMPVGERNGAASASAQFADSFRAYSSNTPYLWSSGDTATFGFEIGGIISQTPGLPAPENYDPGQTSNQLSSFLEFVAYQPGTIDLISEITLNPPPDFNDWLMLLNEIDDRVIANRRFCLGAATAAYCQDGEPNTTIVDLNETGTTPIAYSFNPGGDFDWVANLQTIVHLDASQENVFGLRDFSQTVTASYVGPTGTTTYSGSGLFPDTVALSTVPIPPAVWLFGSALGALGWMRRNISC